MTSTTGAPATSTSPAGLATGHVALNVSDLSRSQPFYEQVLGLQEVDKGSDEGHHWAFLGRDGTLVLTLFEQSSGDFDTGSPGLHHLSFQVADVDAVRAVEDVVRALGAEVFHDGLVAHREGADSGGLFFADPDGIRLEVFAPTGLADSPSPSGSEPTCGFF